MTRHSYTNDDGQHVLPDGGMAAASGGAQVSVAESLAGAGAGFQRLAAQSRLASARAGTQEHRMAANAVAELRANSTLRKDEWVSLDERLVQTARDELKIVDDLRSDGLVVNEDLSTLIREYESDNDFGDAQVDMDAETGGGEDISTFALDGVPLPIVHKSFSIPHRQLLASRERGQDLSAVGQSKATRAVAEALEDMVLNGWAGQVDSYSVSGLTDHPDRNTTSANATWDGASVTQMLGDIYTMVEGLEDANYTPGGSGYRCYINRQQWQEIRRTDTGTDQERSVLDRVMEEFDYVDFAMTNYLDDGEAVMFKPVPDVVELAVAADMQNVEWSSGDGWTTHMKVMASMTPIVKSDKSGASGVFHLTGA